MNIPTEIIVALLALAGAAIPASLLFLNGLKADANADENTANTATALIQTGFGSLVERQAAEIAALSRKLEETDKAVGQKLMGVGNLVQTKADRDYVELLEKRLDRERDRNDRERDRNALFEQRLERAEAELEECKRARLAGNGGPPA